MNNIKKCSISGVAFTLDEEAYKTLEAYLDSLRASYGETADGKEIVADIEARIAELILTTQECDRVVQKPLIDNIIAQMGSARDISEESSEEGSAGESSPQGAPHSAPPLPRHGQRQAGRRMRRHRQILRHRPRMGASGDVPAADIHLHGGALPSSDGCRRFSATSSASSSSAT